MGRRVTMVDTSTQQTRKMTVRNLTRDILCEHHNNSTNDLDQEGGNFARAIEDLFATDAERHKLMDPRAPRLQWSKKVFAVYGPRLERWFMKTAINHAFGRDLPIGGDAVPAGWPTPELVQMVFGRRPVDRAAGAGLVLAGGERARARLRRAVRAAAIRSEQPLHCRLHAHVPHLAVRRELRVGEDPPRSVREASRISRHNAHPAVQRDGLQPHERRATAPLVALHYRICALGFDTAAQ